MKLRFAENSLRLRLRKSDIAKLREHGFVYATVQFGAHRALRYKLRMNDVNEIEAYFVDGMIRVCLPEAVARQWMDGNAVSLSREVPLQNGNALSILIEKDFPCQHQVGEDKADTFHELVAS